MRVDGRTQWDQVGTCSPEWTEPNCLPAFAPSGQWVREPGRDVFHGGEIIWFGKRQGEVTWLGKHYDGYPPAPSEGEHVGLDPRTHEPVAFRNYDEGALIAESWVRQRKPDVAAGRLSFAVPDGEIEGYLRQSARTAFSADGVSTPFAAVLVGHSHGRRCGSGRASATIRSFPSRSARSSSRRAPEPGSVRRGSCASTTRTSASRSSAPSGRAGTRKARGLDESSWKGWAAGNWAHAREPWGCSSRKRGRL
jgi:hypothetical protein